MAFEKEKGIAASKNRFWEGKKLNSPKDHPMFEYLFPQDFEWFRLFYLLAIGTGLVLVVRASMRDAVPLSTSLSLFLWVATFGIIGSKVLEIPSEGWNAFFQTGDLDGGYGRTALGGLLGGMLGLAIGRRLLGLGPKVWSWFVSWPLVLVLFRVGCLFVGCCIGTPTELPWGISYALDSPIAHLQHEGGLLGHHDLCTVPAHPTPLYEILFAGLLLFATWRLSKLNWRKEALFFMGVGAYAAMRFCEEFIRPEYMDGNFLNPAQWGLLLAVPVMGLLAWKLQTQATPTFGQASKPGWEWISLLMPLALVLALGNFWTPAEVFSLGFALLALGVAKWQAYSKAGNRRQHWAMVPASLVMAVFLMSQAAIDQTVPVGTVQESVEVGVGGTYGRYRETCGNTHRYWSTGAGAAYSYNMGGKHQIDAGIKAYYSYDREPGTQEENYLAGGNPYVEYQNRWVGAQLGVHIGNLLTNGQQRTILPSAQLRIGPSDLFFAEGRVYSAGFAPIPGTFAQVGIGSGFGLKNGTVFRLGMGTMGVYLHPSIVVQKDFLLEPMLSYGDESNWQFGLGLRYRIRPKAAQ
jgi:phosphatidylglycerol:prolipoprotein diacylglycerol transferase